MALFSSESLGLGGLHLSRLSEVTTALGHYGGRRVCSPAVCGHTEDVSRVGVRAHVLVRRVLRGCHCRAHADIGRDSRAGPGCVV